VQQAARAEARDGGNAKCDGDHGDDYGPDDDHDADAVYDCDCGCGCGYDYDRGGGDRDHDSEPDRSHPRANRRQERWHQVGRGSVVPREWKPLRRYGVDSRLRG
jgi:hypothetical protein